MKYNFIDGKFVECTTNSCESSNVAVEIIEYSKGEIPKAKSERIQIIYNEVFLRKHSRYDVFENIDILCMNFINIEKFNDEPIPIFVVIESNIITFYTTQPKYIESIINNITYEKNVNFKTCDIIFYLMYRMIKGDLIYLESIEKKLNNIEDDAMADNTDNTISKKILKYKKHLMRIELYYEQFANLVDDMIQNLNGFLEKSTIKKLRTLSSKLERLNTKTINLINYASEIRSAYQAQVDLQLNKSMKILTIITVIVLPLTLIAGWYGMNFNMPEYASQIGYPVVIIVSIILIIGSIIYFKRHKWF